MFDFSFSELLVIGAVALVVIGPERMPKVARTVGLLFGRAQRYVAEIKADINNQLKLDELRKIEADLRAKASNAEHVIIEETRHVEQEFRSVAEQVTPATTPLVLEADAAAEKPGEPQPLPSAEIPAVASPQLELGLDSARSHPAETSSK
ncbi:MAG: Sec-independent protein translocase protein TatB [Sulfuricella sp.]